ncbi:MAG: hypothetical protein Q9N67_03345 [Ghiorsea sp.]|nr:hypothetical protein [Ghiorsea sp.]
MIITLGMPALAGINHSSHLTWQSQESAHFRVHFYEGEATLAQETLNIAEAVYQRLTPIFDWYPATKTEIVLSDEMDMSNGFAMPIPSSRITLFVSRPNSVNSLEDHAGWLETLILHEFVHTLHLDKARRGPKNIRNIFGRILLAFPNIYMPPWMHEGLATYYETDTGLGIGRGQSSYFQMMMRMEVASGIKPLRQINQLMVSWPLLTSRYLYGVYFEQFIADTYGADTLQQIVNHYSDNWLPFAINTVYEEVLGKDLSQLWDEFEVYLKQKFKPQISKLQVQSITQAQALTQSGDFKQSVLQTDDGHVYFVSDNLASGAKLMQQYQGKITALLELNAGAKLDWHKQAGLLLVQPDICDNANSYFDIYRVDDDGHLEQLTECARYIDAVWSPDGSQIAAIKNYRGQHAIHLLDLNGELLEVLWQGKDDETLSGLDWSDDGALLVSSIWRQHTGWDVETFDVSSKTWSKTTHDMFIQIDARFVQNSHDIVFSADYDDVYNIYRQHEDGKLTQLTRVLGGLFSPYLSQQGELLAIAYQNQGFDVVSMNNLLNSSVSFDDSPKASQGKQFPVSDVEISDPEPYSAWDSALPTSWLPLFGLSNEGVELGALVFGSDVLNRHNYSLYAGYQSVSSSPVFNLDYIYDGWQPLLRINAQKLQTPSLDHNNRLIALVEQQSLNAELIFPWLKQQSRWTAHLALNHRRDELVWLAPLYTGINTSFQDSLAGAALVYDSRVTYPRGVSRASTGSIVSLQVESGKGLGGTYTGNVGVLSGRTFFNLGDEQVLGFRLDLGKGDSNARPFTLGGTSHATLIPDLLNPLQASLRLNQRVYSLRGYADAALSGSALALASLEYRFPIARIERGWMTPPMGIHQLFGQVFADAGRAGNDLNTATTYTGIGAELGGDFILFYNLPVRAQLGIAKGLDDTLGGNQFYFRLGSSF